MRNSKIVLGLLATIVASTPMAAQATPAMSRADMQECMFTALPIAALSLHRGDPEDRTEAIFATGSFWGNEADKLGQLTATEEQRLDARLEMMLDDFEAAVGNGTLAQFAAPYETRWAECERQRKAMQTG